MAGYSWRSSLTKITFRMAVLHSPMARLIVMCVASVDSHGKSKLVCFDKTGTLTEDSLDMEGVITSTNKQSVISASTVAMATISLSHHTSPSSPALSSMG